EGAMHRGQVGDLANPAELVGRRLPAGLQHGHQGLVAAVIDGPRFGVMALGGGVDGVRGGHAPGLLPRLAPRGLHLGPRPPKAAVAARDPSRPALAGASRATVAPWRANSTAVARPTPAEAPVTTTILLASSDMEDLHRLVGIIR